MTALGLWGYRHIPSLAVATARAITPGALVARSRALRVAAAVYESALRGAAAPDCGASEASAASAPAGEPALRQPVRRRSRGPVTAATLHRRYARDLGVPYGPAPEHRLDVWRHSDSVGEQNAPVLLYFPGGGWVFGSRRLQSYSMLARLARSGWVCLSVDYRVAPHHPWPAHIEDVKRAIAWAKQHATRYGGNPEFLAVAGSSAGGHLASLAALTANDPAFQPGFEQADTSINAVVSLYGRYDWESREGAERARFMNFLERVVVQRRQRDCPATFAAASPLARVHAGAPPFLVIHGDADTIIPVAQARAFVEALRRVSSSPVAYAELPDAQHAFDMMYNIRTANTVDAVERFLVHTRGSAAKSAGSVV